MYHLTMVEIKNSVLSVIIDPKGAELAGIKFKDREYLWQGDSASWAGRSPQLFPVIGSCPEGGWDFRGKKIVMGNHGFARHSLFELVEQTETNCVFRLIDSGDTRAQYPFPFILDIRYTLDKDGLQVDYRVENPAKDILPFSIGAHPGFVCPLDPCLGFDDYYLEFDKNETISRRYKSVFLTGETETLLDNARRIDLDYCLFNRGAVIFSGLQSESVILKSDASPYSVRMDFAGFPDFGFWTIPEKNAHYVCLEPWFGVDSSEGDSADFEKKEGIRLLEGGGIFACSYGLSFT